MSQGGRVRNRVFVTGVIRSGTTFVGDILSHGIGVDYIHEPFHGAYTLPENRELLPRYISENPTIHDLDEYNDQLDKLLGYRIRMRSSRYDGDSFLRKRVKRIVGSRGPFYLRMARVNPFSNACIIKDPVGKFVAGHLYRRYAVTPVVVVKHPVSLAASLTRVKWYPELQEFRDQPDLIRDHFAGEDEFFARTWPTRLHEAMAHWRATYTFLLNEAERYGDWPIVVHETLSANPVEEFSRLYERLGLQWTSSVERKVERLTSSSSPSERSGRVQDFKRDSASIFEHRRAMVPQEVRGEIFEVVKDVALRLYDRDSFAID